MEIHVLKLEKLPKEEQDETGIIRWMRFLGAKSRRKFEKMAEKDSYMEEAYEMLKHMSVDEKKRLEYEAREKAIRDYHSQMQGMREEGFAEGKEQGKKAGEMRKATNIITNMLRKGKSPEEIADLTGEELEEILEIKRQEPPRPRIALWFITSAPGQRRFMRRIIQCRAWMSWTNSFFRGSMNGIMGFPGTSGRRSS